MTYADSLRDAIVNAFNAQGKEIKVAVNHLGALMVGGAIDYGDNFEKLKINDGFFDSFPHELKIAAIQGIIEHLSYRIEGAKP